jgi:circadian clock protein KaiC
LIAAKKLAVDYVRVERAEIEETGEYDLEGLFVRLAYAIRTVGAKRVVLDTIESLFAGLKNDGILRSELRRLFSWLKDQGVTAIITGERGEGAPHPQGLEEYISDAVILLDHRVHDQVSTRRLRVVKYRGSTTARTSIPSSSMPKASACCPCPRWPFSITRRWSAYRRALPSSTECSAARGTTVGARSSCPARPGPGKTSLGASLSRRACRGANGACASSSKSHRSSS